MFSELQKNENKSFFNLKNYLSFDNTYKWIVILLSLIAVLNFLFLFIYHQQAIETAPNQSFYASIWKYFGSDAFNYITITLLLPILILFIENLFEVRKTVNERINERRKTAEERREKDRQSGRDARWKLVEKSSNIYIDFFNSLSELAHFQKNKSKSSKKDKDAKEENNKNINDIRNKLDNSVNSINTLFNEWYHMFPNLNPAEGRQGFPDHICYLVNVLLNSALTIGYYVEQNNDPNELVELKHTIATIQNCLQSIIYHNTITVLKSSILLWEGSLENESQKIDKANAEIKSRLEGSEAWSKKIVKLEMKNNEFLSNVEGQEREDFCESYKKLEKFALDNPKEDYKKSKEYENVVESFRKIKHEQLATSIGRYSIDYVRKLSDELYLENTLDIINDRIYMMRDQDS